VIDARKGAFAHHVPMIVGPTADHRVEGIDQIGGRYVEMDAGWSMADGVRSAQPRLQDF
jgi:hypothetical protein